MGRGKVKVRIRVAVIVRSSLFPTLCGERTYVPLGLDGDGREGCGGDCGGDGR